MPFLRAPKGTKIVFTSARLSALLSLAYVAAMGDKMPKYRRDIQTHCGRIFEVLERVYGSGEHDEWPGSAIQKEIEAELRTNAPMEVHEAFVSLKVNEFDEPKRKAADTTKAWNRFDAKPAAAIPLVDADRIDPIWSISDQKTPVAAPIERLGGLPFGLAERMGVAAAQAKQKAGVATDVSPSGPPVRRSTWIAFWKNLPKKHIPWHVWERHVLAVEPVHFNKTADEWWMWWQGQLDLVMRKDPRMYEIRRALHEWRQKCRVTNRGWTDGVASASGIVGPVGGGAVLDHSPTGHVWYRRLAVEHLKNCFSDGDVSWDWTLIHKALRPERDALISWKGWQNLDESLALWPLTEKPWLHGEHPAAGAKELPQWTWMRFCMAMAGSEQGSDTPTKNAIDLYEQISTLAIIPAASAVREAGRPQPRYFEDEAWLAPDQFEAIHRVIYETAVDTKWTGTAAAAWGRVRSKNAPVQAGRRKGAGVNDFVRTIDSHMRSQGRLGDDRPVTANLPIWHLDVEEFIGLRHNSAPRLQPVVTVTDIFMQRVAEGGIWTLLDPHCYPEVLDGSTAGFLAAEAAVEERKKMHPQGHKIIAADRLWKKLLGQARLGSPYMTFSDSDAAYAPVVGAALVHGLDGVGAFPMIDGQKLQNQEAARQVQWPSIAINLDSMISDHGEPQLDVWRETITWAFWVAERMYEACDARLSDVTKHTRPVCLGAVGFYEAVQKAMLGAHHNPDAVSSWVSKISEAWATLVTVVDQAFCQKYGPAPMWEEPGAVAYRPFHPVACYERLKSQRQGGVGMPAMPEEISDLFSHVQAHRFSVRTVWAPFRQAACWAGVSPGGFGTLFPVEWVLDDTQTWRLTPTPFLISELEHDSSDTDYGCILSKPEQPTAWPDHIRRLCAPDMPEWKVRLTHAALVRPWIDQGVSLTLPAGLPVNQLSILVQQAWWMGLSNVRFEDPFRQPDRSEAPRDGAALE